MQYAPVSGTIQEINEILNDQPGLLNKSPEDEGSTSHRDREPPPPTQTYLARLALQDQGLGPH